MPRESVRVVIRQSLHPLLDEWSKVLGIEDFGEIVNYLLLELKRNGYTPNSKPITVSESLSTSDNKATEVGDLAGLF